MLWIKIQVQGGGQVWLLAEMTSGIKRWFLLSSRHPGCVCSSLTLCSHPERSRSSRPIQCHPIIIDLSVWIFINNNVRDDPAGMLMSPLLELIRLERNSVRSAFPCGPVCAAVQRARRRRRRRCRRAFGWRSKGGRLLSCSTSGFHKRSASSAKSPFSSQFMSTCFGTSDLPSNPST